jgi:hypothetical protein
MKRAALGLLLPLALAGCYVGPGYGPGPGPAPGYGVASVNYDAYYDGFYGPAFDGYWAGGVFYYRHDANHPYVRDDAGHFRRAPAPGFNGVHVHGGGDGHPGANAGGGHEGGGHP